MTPPQRFIPDLLDTVRVMRENLSRQEILLEELVATLQQSESQQQQQTVPCADLPTPAWLPEKDDAEVTTGSLPAPKLRRVEQRIGTPDILARLKKTAAGHIYEKHLKQIPFIRSGVIWTWRNLYPIYTNISIFFGSHTARRWRTLIKLEEYVKITNLTITKLLDRANVETPAPAVFPAEDVSCLVSPHDRYDYPSVYVAEISDAEVYGGTNLVFTRNGVICHDLYDFERDYTSEELHGRHLIDVKKRRMRLLCHDVAPERIPIAATFVDACASNYAHWLTEVLPRVASFCFDDRFANIPIIVNDGLHPNIIESLVLVAGGDREIISLPIGRAIKVDSLCVTSVAGYVPFERRDSKLTDHSHGLFSSTGFDAMRQMLIKGVASGSFVKWPEKIYLRRNAGIRKVINSAEIENALVARGYAVVEPERLTFIQQVQMFSQAKSVVASTGAAITNIIFCPPGVHISIFISRSPDASYWYWQNIAAASGNVVCYVLGEVKAGTAGGIHADYHVKVDSVLKSL